jgi:hypothetical protein
MSSSLLSTAPPTKSARIVNLPLGLRHGVRCGVQAA